MKWLLGLMIPTFIFSNIHVVKKDIKILTQKNIKNSFDTNSTSTYDKNNPFIIDKSIDFKNITHTFSDFVYIYDGLYQIYPAAKLSFPSGFMTGSQHFYKNGTEFVEPGLPMSEPELQTGFFIDGTLLSDTLKSIKTSFVVRSEGVFYIGKKAENALCSTAVIDGSVMFNQSLLSALQIKATSDAKVIFYKENRLYADQVSYLEGDYYFQAPSRYYASDVTLSCNDTLLDGKNIVFKNATLHIDVVFDNNGELSFPKIRNVHFDENVTIKFYFLQSYSEKEKRKIDFNKFVDLLSEIKSQDVVHLSEGRIQTMPKVMFLSTFDEAKIFEPYRDIITELKDRGITLVLEEQNKEGEVELILSAKKNC